MLFFFLFYVAGALAIDNVAFDTLKSITPSDRKVIQWNYDTHQCNPKDTCKGAKLIDIPGFDSKISTGLLKNIELFDSLKIRSCFQNKYILFLGDHMLRETLHDIITILTGLNHNASAYKNYRNRFSNKHKDSHDVATKKSVKIDTTTTTTDASISNEKVDSDLNTYITHAAVSGYPSVEFHQHGTHMTISTIPSSSLITTLDGNKLHINDCNITFGFLNHGVIRSDTDNDRLRDNLRNTDSRLCLVKDNITDMCRQPDKLVAQLSSHNGEKELWEKVVSYLPAIMTLLREHRDKGVDVFFKGTIEQGIHKSRIEYINLVAMYHSLNKDINYMDIPAVTSLFNRHFNIATNSTSSINMKAHFNSHDRSGVLRQYKKDAVTYTNWITQYVLNYLCVPTQPRCTAGSCRKRST